MLEISDTVVFGRQRPLLSIFTKKKKTEIKFLDMPQTSVCTKFGSYGNWFLFGQGVTDNSKNRQTKTQIWSK